MFVVVVAVVVVVVAAVAAAVAIDIVVPVAYRWDSSLATFVVDLLCTIGNGHQQAVAVGNRIQNDHMTAAIACDPHQLLRLSTPNQPPPVI